MFASKRLERHARSGDATKIRVAATHKKTPESALRYLYSLENPDLTHRIASHPNFPSDLRVEIIQRPCLTASVDHADWSTAWNEMESSCRNAKWEATVKLSFVEGDDTLVPLISTVAGTDKTCEGQQSIHAFFVIWETRREEFYNWYERTFNVNAHELPESWVIKSMGWENVHAGHNRIKVDATAYNAIYPTR